MDADVTAAMGISGFGKKPRKRQLDAARFDKAKREQVCPQLSHSLQGIANHHIQLPSPSPAQGGEQHAGSSHAAANPSHSSSANADIDASEPHSTASASQQEGLSAEEPEYDPDEDYGDSGQADLPEFPITHELILKDHTKVVSALALDPSGARILSGSHDYDCKLWDFGGMDQRCKPFKSWEPAESYHVRPHNFSTISVLSNTERLRYMI